MNKTLTHSMKSYITIFLVGILVGCICRLTDYCPADTLWSFSSIQTLLGFWIITNTIIVLASTSNICAGISSFLYMFGMTLSGNVKKCAVGKHPKSEKHGNTAQFSEVERSGTQENCGGIGSGCRLRLHPLPVLRRRQSHRVACIDPDAVVVDKNIAKNDRFDLFSR